MLAGFVIAYLVVSVLIGLWAARRVHNSEDFMLAGRSLPIGMATFTVFATWFGSETLLGASATFADEGLLGVIEDPFGATLCLVLVGVFFARYFYRLNILTLVDFYRKKFGAKAEWIAALCMCLSFFSWVAGQLIALGIVMHTILGTTVAMGIIISTAIVAIYTLAGGMWSVAVTDFVQTICIIVGIVLVAFYLTPPDFQFPVNDLPEHFFSFVPHERSWLEWSNYLCAWITLGLGSIPSQDIFQRVMSSKDEKVAARSAIYAGILYLVIGMIPLYLAYLAKYVWHVPAADNQALVTMLVLQKTPLAVQILFFGALVSAVLSTASGALIAPASVISHNIVKRVFRIPNDRGMLLVERLSILVVAFISMFLSLSNDNIYELVGEASAIGLVSLFVPLIAGMYAKQPSEAGAIASMIFGICSYVFCSYIVVTAFPALLIGLGVSLLAYGLFAAYWKFSLN